jgi:hypothetical protein
VGEGKAVSVVTFKRLEDGLAIFRAECDACGQPMEFDSNLCGKYVACPGCKVDFRLPKYQQIEPAELNKFTREVSLRDIDGCRAIGVKFVRYLGCNNPGEDCAKVKALKGKNVPINEALPLPLPGCKMKVCKCIIVCGEDKNSTKG